MNLSYFMDRVLSGELSCPWTCLVDETLTALAVSYLSLKINPIVGLCNLYFMIRSNKPTSQNCFMDLQYTWANNVC